MDKCGFFAADISLGVNIVHEREDTLRGKWLRDYPIHSRLFLFIGSNSFAPASDHGDGYCLAVLTNGVRKLPTTHAGHADVGKDGIKFSGLEKFERLTSARSRIDDAALEFQEFSKQFANTFLIVDN